MRSRQQEQGLSTGFEIYKIMPTLAERLIQEGVEEARETMAIRALKMGLSTNTIADITELPLERIEQLKLKVTHEQSSQIACTEQKTRTGEG